MGRASLFIYWIHVELVYGYASWLWRGQLPLWGALAAFMVFAALMYAAIGLRDWVVDTTIRRRTGRSSLRPAPGR
jgi:succinate dehydrogenase hydrophobic anchor subunit